MSADESEVAEDQKKRKNRFVSDEIFYFGSATFLHKHSMN